MIDGDAAFGDNLRAARLAQGLTQQQLAERAGLCEKKTVWEYEKGNRDPRLSVMRRFSAALGCDVAALVAEREEAEHGTLRS